MPLTAIALLPFGKTRTAPLPLAFIADARTLRQTRVVGRTALVPDLDLSEYRLKAVIDWIEIRVAFKTVTQHRYVQEVLTKYLPRQSMITPVSPGDGGECNNFDIRIQEPESLARVMEIYDALELRFGELTDPLVRAVEFSLDAYPRKPSDEARALLIGAMQRTVFTTRDIWSNPRSRPRTSIGLRTAGLEDLNNRKLLVEGDDGKPGVAYLRPENHRPAFVDGTMYFGDRDNDDVMIRVMDKVRDVQNREKGTYKIISETEKRVRIEVRVQGHELLNLGLFELRDSRSFSFTKLPGRYFQFKLPTFCSEPVNDMPITRLAMIETERDRLTIFLNSGVLGLQARDFAQANLRLKNLPEIRMNCRERGGVFAERRVSVGVMGSFVAYDGLSREVALAFRHLADREERAWNRRARRAA